MLSMLRSTFGTKPIDPATQTRMIPQENESVIIIGAGITGLMMASRMPKHITSMKIFEKRNKIGGVFAYDEDPDIFTVAQYTVLSSSRNTTQMSNHHYPKGSNDFLHQEDMAKYIRSIADHFDVMKHIQFNTEVVSVTKDKERNKWIVRTRSVDADSKEAKETIHECDKLVIASGLHSEVLPLEERYQGFKGEIMPVHTIKKIDPEKFRGKKVLVAGTSEFAGDITFELLPIIKNSGGELHWSGRGHPQFFKARGRPVGDAKSSFWSPRVTSYDSLSNGAISAISPPKQGKPGSAWGCSYTTAGHINSRDGHDVPEWSEADPIDAFQQFQSKKADVLPWVRNRTIIPHGDINRIDGNKIRFVDRGKDGVLRTVEHEFDIFIPSFGFAPNLKFLPKEYQDYTQDYLFAIHPDDPTICKVGFTRPTITSMPVLADLTTLLIHDFWSGLIGLPKDMTAKQREYKVSLEKLFCRTKGRMKSLVDATEFADKILDHLVTPEREADFIERMGGVIPAAIFKYFGGSGTWKLHIVLDKSTTPEEIAEFWKWTGETWTQSNLQRVGLTGMILIARMTGMLMNHLPGPVQDIFYRGVNWVWTSVYGKGDFETVYVTKNPYLRKETVEFYNAVVLDGNNEPVKMEWPEEKAMERSERPRLR